MSDYHTPGPADVCARNPRQPASACERAFHMGETREAMNVTADKISNTTRDLPKYCGLDKFPKCQMSPPVGICTGVKEDPT